MDWLNRLLKIVRFGRAAKKAAAVVYPPRVERQVVIERSSADAHFIINGLLYKGWEIVAGPDCFALGPDSKGEPQERWSCELERPL